MVEICEKMKKSFKYCVFETKWGYFGLGGTDCELWVSQLPGRSAGEVEALLLEGLEGIGRLLLRSVKSYVEGAGGITSSCISKPQSDRSYFKAFQEQIAAYFDGDCFEFGPDVPLYLGCKAAFTQAVLGSCRKIGFAQTITYSDLAKLAGRPKASRAVGHAMAVNPLPLIIPCHRVVRTDGGLGGFSAVGGVAVKKRMLDHERSCAK